MGINVHHQTCLDVCEPHGIKLATTLQMFALHCQGPGTRKLFCRVLGRQGTAAPSAPAKSKSLWRMHVPTVITFRDTRLENG